MAKHHYVPEFLLKHWHSGPDNRLSRMGWERGVLIHKRRSARMCAQRHSLYRIEGYEQPEAIEEIFLGRVDGAGARIHQRFLAFDRASEYSSEDRLDWTRFLVALMRRHPAYIEYLRKQGQAAYEEAVAEFRATAKPGEDFEEWMRVAGSVQARNIGVADLFQHLVNSTRANELLLRARWKVRRLKYAQFDLLLGDRPVIWTGRLDQDYVLSLPLSPRCAFFAFTRPEYGARIDKRTETEMAKSLNRDAVAGAHSHVFGTSAGQIPLVEKLLPKDPSPYQELRPEK